MIGPLICCHRITNRSHSHRLADRYSGGSSSSTDRRKSNAASLTCSRDVRLRASSSVRRMYRRSRSEISKSWV